MSVTTDLLEQKKRMVNCLRIMVGEGLFEMTFGHLSCRIPEVENKFLVLGHLHDKGINLNEVTADGIVTMDEWGETGPDEMDAPGERFIYTEIYKRRPDVQAIVHCHPVLATCFSIAGVEIQPVNHLGLIFAPSVPIHDYSGQIDTHEKAAAMVDTLGDRPAVLLRSHGVTVTGRSIEKACLATTLLLEHTAKMQMIAGQIGTARPVPLEYAVSEAGSLFTEGMDEREYFEATWAHYAYKYRDVLYDVDPVW